MLKGIKKTWLRGSAAVAAFAAVFGMAMVPMIPAHAQSWTGNSFYNHRYYAHQRYPHPYFHPHAYNWKYYHPTPYSKQYYPYLAFGGYRYHNNH